MLIVAKLMPKKFYNNDTMTSNTKHILVYFMLLSAQSQSKSLGNISMVAKLMPKKFYNNDTRTSNTKHFLVYFTLLST
jgi:hypothetical protein